MELMTIDKIKKEQPELYARYALKQIAKWKNSYFIKTFTDVFKRYTGYRWIRVGRSNEYIVSSIYALPPVRENRNKNKHQVISFKKLESEEEFNTKYPVFYIHKSGLFTIDDIDLLVMLVDKKANMDALLSEYLKCFNCGKHIELKDNSENHIKTCTICFNPVCESCKNEFMIDKQIICTSCLNKKEITQNESCNTT